MANDSPDGLYDTSEPALSNRLDRFAQRLRESPAERAAHAMVDAVEDVSLAIWTAPNPETLEEIRGWIEQSIEKLATAASVALSLREHWSDRR